MLNLLPAMLSTARSSLQSRRELVLENLAQRQQLAVLGRRAQLRLRAWRTLHTSYFIYLRRLTKFYVDEHNRVLPHAAFDGQTPDEMYFGVRQASLDRRKGSAACNTTGNSMTLPSGCKSRPSKA